MIPLIKSTFYNENKTKKDLCRFIKSASQLSFGKECQKFENKFAKWQKRKHCIFLNSGSSANLAIIQALLNLGEIKKNDFVGFSALTWSTNVMPLIQLGLSPVPVDVELDTLNISSKKLLETLRTQPIKLLFLTNLLGFCDDIDEIKKICQSRKIILLEDNCESLGTIYKGSLLGNYGLASTFSFYVGHHMSTVEGGAVLTNNERLATMLRLVRAHGWDRNLSEKKQIKIRDKHHINSTFYSRYTFYDVGYNLRPTELNGFIGNTQLPYLSDIIKKRNKNFLTFSSLYSQVNKYYPISFRHIDFLSNFAVPLVCRTKKIRDELVEACKGKIEIRPIVGGDMTMQPFFKKHVAPGIFGNSNARLVHEQGLYFGNNPELTQKEINTILDVFS